MRMRGTAVRALKRMQAWTELRWIAASDPSERIRRMASKCRSRNFRSTLQAFATGLIPIAHERSHRSVYLSPQVDLNHTVGTKSREWIRRLLEKIRLLVRGGTVMILACLVHGLLGT